MQFTQILVIYKLYLYFILLNFTNKNFYCDIFVRFFRLVNILIARFNKYRNLFKLDNIYLENPLKLKTFVTTAFIIIKFISLFKVNIRKLAVW
jgi:hypothetical protein